MNCQELCERAFREVFQPVLESEFPGVLWNIWRVGPEPGSRTAAAVRVSRPSRCSRLASRRSDGPPGTQA